MARQSTFFPAERNAFEAELRAAGSVSEYCRQKGCTRAAVHHAARARGFRIDKSFFYVATGPHAKQCVAAKSGTLLFFAAPNRNMILLSDIAWHLAHIYRFNGGSPILVAEHSILVARMVFLKTKDPWMALCALMHDAHEAYIGDITRPLKQVLGKQVKHLSDRIDWAIADRFELRSVWLEAQPFIKEADDEMVAIEAVTFGIDTTNRWVPVGTKAAPELFDCLSPADAEREFLVTFEKLTAACKTHRIVSRNRIEKIAEEAAQ